MCLGRLKVMAFNPTWRVLCEMWSVKVILKPNIFLFYDLLVSYCFPRHPTTCLQGPQKINLFSAITKNTSFTKQPNRRPCHWATHPQHWLQQMFKRVAIRVAGPDVPKIQALPEWGEEGLIPAWIFLKDVSTYTQGPQRWSFITKKWYFHTKVFLNPQNRSFNHIYLTFSLSKMILLSFLEKCRESHLRTFMGQIAQDAWFGGGGG